MDSRREKGEGTEERSGWDDPVVRMLEELLLDNMRLIFQSAIKEISQWGFQDAVIEKALSRRGLFAGSRDPVTSVVSFTLNFLWVKDKLDSHMDVEFDDVSQLTVYTLTEMVAVLREVRPFLSVSEAMWYLLICDLNVVQACQMEAGSSGFTLAQLHSEEMSSRTRTPTFQDFFKPRELKYPHSFSLANREDEKLASMFRKLENFCGFYEENEKPKRRRSKREMARLMPKPCNADRSFRGSAGMVKVTKIIDRNLKILSTATPSSSLGTGNSSKSLPLKENKLMQTHSLGSKPDSKSNITYDELLGKFLPQDKKEETVLNLIIRLRNLEEESQGWMDWPNQMVMQAARKLAKIQPELKTMRQLTEVVKKSVKDNDLRRLTILENSVKGVNSLVEKGVAVISKLEEENSRVKKELEAAKSKVTESSSDCQAALEREQKAKHEVQTWDGEIGFLQKELEKEKKRLASLHHDLVDAKTSRNKIEAALEKEQNKTGKLLAKAVSIKNERKQLEAMADAELNGMKHKASTLEQKRVDDILKLKCRFSKSLSKSEKQKLEAKCLVVMKGGQNFSNRFASDGLIQDRECVVCLAEENSVVLLPCSHQILCESCCELHEKWGMAECPSCRTPIQRRLKVRFANLK